jgi:hypothetical protein
MAGTVGNTPRRWLAPLCLALLLGGIALPAPAVHAASTLHVASCADSGATTLRGRIASAAAGDTIVFDLDCTGATAITLSTGRLTLAKDVTIDGTGHTVVVDGGCTANCGTTNAVGGDLVLFVNFGVTATLNALTIQNGVATDADGGGIHNDGGALTVTNSRIANNVAISTTSAYPHAGGIYSLRGSLSVANTTFSGNNSVYGGGIYTRFGTGVTVTNSTFSNNGADVGGGIFNDDLYSGEPTLTVTNSTFTGNSDGIVNGGIAFLTNVTITGNGTGIFTDNCNCGVPLSATTLTNSIVAGNGSDAGGLPATNDHSLVGGTPLLGPLGNYGGPTQTVPLLPGSPAIAAGTTGAGIPTSDQRGVARTGHTDIGAFQSQGFTLTRTGGNNQSQQVGVRFSAPLTLTVTATAAGAPWHEPVQGGMLTVTPPASGASATLSGNAASLPANGQVSLTATANGTAGGPYTVTVSANGAPSAVTFSLTNLAVIPHSTFTVGTTGDHAGSLTSVTACRTVGNTTCTLRDAITYAVSGTDTIVFNGTGRGTVTLVGANGPLVLATNVTITGPETVDGGCTGCDVRRSRRCSGTASRRRR